MTRKTAKRTRVRTYQPLEQHAKAFAEEFWLKSTYNPHSHPEPWRARHAAGRELRSGVAREDHGDWHPQRNRPDPLEIVLAANAGRQRELIPLRMARMASSPFTFFRGAAAIMAADLAQTPVTGIPVVIAGDAHLNNFGLCSTAQHQVLFDINDFDEVVPGPWEWDLKRLAASVSIAGRENKMKRRERMDAVELCVLGYCRNAIRYERLGVLDTWYQHLYPERALASWHNVFEDLVDPRIHAIWMRTIEQAQLTTFETLLPQVAQPDTRGNWRFKPDPPILTRVSKASAAKVADSLVDYAKTITPERRFMLQRYRVVDVAHRVVGVGSAGLRVYLVLFFGKGKSDPLFLQVKEARETSYAKYLRPPSIDSGHGWRIVRGQRLLQASTDFMLGWTRIDDRDFYVRQMRHLKATVPLIGLSPRSLAAQAFACGATLARGHARTGDIARIAGYCGRSTVLARALARFAEAYADQNAKDHAALVAAISDGRVKAARSA